MDKSMPASAVHAAESQQNNLQFDPTEAKRPRLGSELLSSVKTLQLNCSVNEARHGHTSAATGQAVP